MPEYYPVYKYKTMLKSMQPVYSLTKGVTNNLIKKSLLNAREAFLKIEDYLSDDIRSEYDLISIRNAIEEIHFPENEEKLKVAIKRLAMDEFLSFLMGVREMRKNNLSISSSHVRVEFYSKRYTRHRCSRSEMPEIRAIWPRDTR